MADTVEACTIRVRVGAVVIRHGRAWVAGELLAVTPSDAAYLVARGDAVRV